MILAIIIGIVLTFQLIIIPHANKKSAIQVIHFVLDHWKDGDVSSTVNYWYNEDMFPAVSYIESYELTWKRFYRTGKNSFVEAYVKIDFGGGSVLESGKEWLFKLTNTPSGWRIVTFKPSHLRSDEYTPTQRAYDPIADRETLHRMQNVPGYKEPTFFEKPRVQRQPVQNIPSPSTTPAPTTKPLLKPFIPPILESEMEADPNATPPGYRTIPAASSQ